MDPLETAEIGRTGLHVTRLGLGGAPFGGLFSDVAEQTAVGSIKQALELGIRYFDTAPLYGVGKSEQYYARALAGVPRDSYVLSTKVGRVLNPTASSAADIPGQDIYRNIPQLEAVFDFSRDGVMRSFEESLKRLDMERVDILFIHDPDDYHQQAVREAFPALAALRSQGVIKAIGAGMNYWEPLAQFAREADFDCFLLAGRYTLLDHSGLKELLPLCEQKQMSIILGGPYNSGILASDLTPGTTYFYREAPPDVLEQARKIKAVCDRHGVPLKAAALQFGLAHPALAATIPGARGASEVEENFRMAQLPIPGDLWAELKHERLIPGEAPTP
jgi:D-threo-aldose 1-dehydrogenase